MSYDLLILAFIMLLFCVFMQIITAKVMLSLFNSVRPASTREVKPVSLVEKKADWQEPVDNRVNEEKERYEAIMRNLEAFDGTGFGQEEVK